jgi:cell division protein FtsA
MDSKGVIGISTPTREITYEDVNRVIEAASAIALPADRRVVDIIPQKFEIDDQKGVDNPIGLTGTRLEATVHLVTCAESFAENIIRSVEKTGYSVSRLILEPLASAEAVLTKDEKELGVAVLDIGGGTADSVVFLDRCIVKTFVVPLGGNDLTRDLAIGLRTPMHNAEDLKVRFGSVWLATVDEDESVEVPGVGGRAAKAVAQTALVEILGARMEEIFMMAKQEIHRLGIYDMLAAGVVLTGGSAKIPGTVELAEEVFELPTRLGAPMNIGGLGDVIGDPSFATGVGLVLYDLMRERPKARRRYRAKGVIRWFKELFRDFS